MDQWWKIWRWRGDNRHAEQRPITEFPEALPDPELVQQLDLLKQGVHSLLENGSYGSDISIYGDGERKPTYIPQLLSYDQQARDTARHFVLPALADIQGLPVTANWQRTEDDQLILSSPDQAVIYYPGDTAQGRMRSLGIEQYEVSMFWYRKSEAERTKPPKYGQRFAARGPEWELGIACEGLLGLNHWDSVGVLNFIADKTESGFTPDLLQSFVLELDSSWEDVVGLFEIEEDTAGRHRYATVTVDFVGMIDYMSGRMVTSNDASNFWVAAAMKYADSFSIESPQKLYFTDLGKVTLEGQEYSIWTQGQRPKVSQAAPKPATSKQSVSTLTPAPQPSQA